MESSDLRWDGLCSSPTFFVEEAAWLEKKIEVEEVEKAIRWEKRKKTWKAFLRRLMKIFLGGCLGGE